MELFQFGLSHFNILWDWVIEEGFLAVAILSSSISAESGFLIGPVLRERPSANDAGCLRGTRLLLRAQPVRFHCNALSFRGMTVFECLVISLSIII